jgi:hypothetical protein
MSIIYNISNPTKAVLVDSNGNEIDVSVQDLINALCNVLDGEQDHDLFSMLGDQDMADEVARVRGKVRSLWTHPDGTKVL